MEDFGMGMDELDNMFSDDMIDNFVNQIVTELNFDDFNIIDKLRECTCEEAEEREALIAILCENEDMMQKAIYSQKIEAHLEETKDADKEEG